jgi:two-component system chemotaxis response regulator CheB
MKDAASERSPLFAAGAFEVVAIAASAGGLNALSFVLSGLTRDFPAAILVVQHLDPRHPSFMADILQRRTALQVKEAEEGERLKLGTVFVAPPNRHLLVNPDATIALTQTELVHFVRPSADLMFESVAAVFRDRAIAVVLSGTGSDGSMGVGAIRKMGGKVLAQDEKSSEFFGMPSAAIRTGHVDLVVPLEDIPATLVRLVTQGDLNE